MNDIYLREKVNLRLIVSSILKYFQTTVFILARYSGLWAEAVQTQNFWCCWLRAGAGSPSGRLPLGTHQDGPQEISAHVTYGCHHTALST